MKCHMVRSCSTPLLGLSLAAAVFCVILPGGTVTAREAESFESIAVGGSDVVVIAGRDITVQGGINVYEQGTLIISDSSLLSGGAITTSGGATMVFDHVDMVGPHPEIAIDGASVVDFLSSSLDWFHSHNASRTHVADSTLRDFHVHDQATATLDGCSVSQFTILLDVPGITHELAGVHPGTFANWSLGDVLAHKTLGYTVTLNSTAVEDIFVFNNYPGVQAIIGDSVLGYVGCYGAGSSYMLNASSVDWLNAREFDGVLTGDGSTVGGFAAEDSQFSISGHWRFGNAEAQLTRSAVLREYDVVAPGYAGALVELVNPQGQVVETQAADSSGQVLFSVLFDDQTRGDTWTARVPEIGGSASIRLTTTTPILIIRDEESLLEEMLSVQFSISADAVASLIGEFGLAQVRSAAALTTSYERFILLLRGCDIAGNSPLGEPVWLGSGAIEIQFLLVGADGGAVIDYACTLSLVRIEENGSLDLMDVRVIPVDPGSGVYSLSYPTETLGPGQYICYLGTWIAGQSYAFVIRL